MSGKKSEIAVGLVAELLSLGCWVSRPRTVQRPGLGDGTSGAGEGYIIRATLTYEDANPYHPSETPTNVFSAF